MVHRAFINPATLLTSYQNHLELIFKHLFRPKLGGFLLVFMLPFHQQLDAQAFQKMHIRDLAEMRDNWGNAVADYDQDGDLDIFITAYHSFRSNDPTTWSRLLKNNGSGWFEDVTIEAGFRHQYASNTVRDNKLGVSWGDFDNDGYPDLMLTHAGHLQLYRNQGNGSFEDVTESANISTCPECVNTSALWWDYDKDGDLDLYISDYQNTNRLFNNQGDGTFGNVTIESKLGDPGSTWCSIPIDANQDSWMDLYVINDYGQSRLYLNEQGQTFEEATLAYGLRNTGNGMGASIGDYNNDGHFDIYVTNIAEFQANALFTGSASGEFKDDQASQEVGQGHWGWGTHFFDADHDGDEDLYLVNGFNDLIYPNKFFKNMHAEGQNHFVDWSSNAATDGQANGMGMEVFDYDEDGDLDILVSNTNDAPYLYQSVGRGAHTNWLQVELEGTVSNRNAFGTVIIASGEGKTHHRFHYGAGIMSQSIKPVHFGLGDIKTLDSLVIIWPNSEKEVFHDVPANQKIKIVEHDSAVTSTTEKIKKAAPLKLSALYPNPFQEAILIEVETQQSGRLHHQIYTSMGELVWQGQQEIQAHQTHQILWSGTDRNGSKQASGMYFYTLQLNGHQISGKIILQ